MFLTLKKRTLLAAIIMPIIAALAVVGFYNVTPYVTTNAAQRKLPVYAVQTNEKVVALTFDAAWGADKTQGIIDILSTYGAGGTFFLVGFWIEKYPEKVQAIHKAGFTIGNHSNNHLQASSLAKTEMAKEIKAVNDQLQELIGVKPVFFRPPFGDYNNSLIECCEEQQMIAVQWDVDSLDWKGLSGAEIAQRVLPRVKSGSIVLFHNNSDCILDALPLIILQLKQEDYRFVSLDELVYKENYTINRSGIQIKYTEEL